MGVVFPSKVSRLCSAYEEPAARVIVVGLDSAGKTTLVQRFKNLSDLQINPKATFISNIPTEPTLVYLVETIYPRLAPLALNLWDLGGNEKTRELWRFYITGIQGIIFVIDCHDRQRIDIAKAELVNLTQQITNSSKIPIVIAANKQDLPNPLTKENLIEALALPHVSSNEWKIFETSALSGGGVLEMFSYLSEYIHRHRRLSHAKSIATKKLS